MSKASCCCGLNASAATGADTTGRMETDAANREIQKRCRDVGILRHISRNILLSHNATVLDEFRQPTCSLARFWTRHTSGAQPSYLVSLTAITSISTRN